MSLYRTIICCLLIGSLSLGCSDANTVDASGIESVDPGRCTVTPDLDPLWIASENITGADVSCQYVAWLAPTKYSDTSAAPQVYVHDLTNDLTFRTTEPDDSADASTDSSEPERWSPALHGFWLAYGEGNTIVAENLRDLERATFVGNPRVGGTVDVHFPWVVWEDVSPAGRTAIKAGHLLTGEISTVSNDVSTAVDPVVDDGRVVFTVWEQDGDGPDNGLQGPSRVYIATLGAEDSLRPVDEDTVESRSAGLYDELLVYVRIEGDSVTLVARNATTLAEVGSVLGGIDAATTRPTVGRGVVTWELTNQLEAAYAAWWPYMAQVDEVPVDANAIAEGVSVGEHLVVALLKTSDGSVLWVDRLAPQ